MSDCKCRSIREKVLGDGCDICSPVMALGEYEPVTLEGWTQYHEVAIGTLRDSNDELEQQLADLREKMAHILEVAEQPPRNVVISTMLKAALLQEQSDE